MTTPADFCGPTRIDAAVVLPPSVPVTDVIALLVETLHRHGLQVIGWTVGVGGGTSTGSLDELLAVVGRTPEPLTLTADVDARGLAWVMVKRRDGSQGSGADEDYGDADCLSVVLESGLELDDPDDVRQALTCQAAVVRAFCDRFDVRNAHVRRVASTYVPRAPQGWDERPVMVVARRDVEAGYADPGPYWRSWDTRDELGDDRVLVTRALDVLDERDYKRAVYPRIWELVHAARPGTCTRFGVADLWPQDLPHFDEGEGFLRQLGYDARDQSIEFTAVVPDGEHLRPREIMLWARHLSNGRLPAGELLSRVKFTFVDAAMADREKRPLLDAGIEVWCYAADGTLVQVRR